MNIDKFISVKGFKAIGNRLTNGKVKEINLLDPIPYKEEIIEVENNDSEIELDNKGENNTKDGQIKLEL